MPDSDFGLSAAHILKRVAAPQRCLCVTADEAGVGAHLVPAPSAAPDAPARSTVAGCTFTKTKGKSLVSGAQVYCPPLTDSYMLTLSRRVGQSLGGRRGGIQWLLSGNSAAAWQSAAGEGALQRRWLQDHQWRRPIAECCSGKDMKGVQWMHNTYSHLIEA